jgi:hypothetical protein
VQPAARNSAMREAGLILIIRTVGSALWVT